MPKVREHPFLPPVVPHPIRPLTSMLPILLLEWNCLDLMILTPNYGNLGVRIIFFCGEHLVSSGFLMLLLSLKEQLLDGSNL